MIEIRLTDAARTVILGLPSAEARAAMIECLRQELDPIDRTPRAEIRFDGQTHTGRALSNGWIAIYRKDGIRFINETFVVFDLLDPGTSLYGGHDLGLE